MSRLTFIQCRGDLEQLWALSLCAEQERAQIAAERDELVDEDLRLNTLDLHHALDDGADPDEYISHYADRPYVVVRPQVFEL